MIGLPFTGDEPNIDNLAQTHAQYLVDNNTTGHIDGNGLNAFQRIAADPVLGPCHNQLLNRAENIAYFWSGGPPNPLYIERAIYLWIYADTQSLWGHRETALLQDFPLPPGPPIPGFGFINDVGSPADEGYFGIGVAESASYNPLGYNWPSIWGTVVVMDMFDPITTGSCPWDQAPTATPTDTAVPPTATAYRHCRSRRQRQQPHNPPVPPTATTASPAGTNRNLYSDPADSNSTFPPTATQPANQPIPPTSTVPPTATATFTAAADSNGNLHRDPADSNGPPTHAVPPTATATFTAIPPTATATNTAVPPTATATFTAMPPTATDTPSRRRNTASPRPANSDTNSADGNAGL